MQELIDSVPWGVHAVALLVAVSGLVATLVPDEKLPGPVAAILNFVALNFGKAKNDPEAQ